MTSAELSAKVVIVRCCLVLAYFCLFIDMYVSEKVLIYSSDYQIITTN